MFGAGFGVYSCEAKWNEGNGERRMIDGLRKLAPRGLRNFGGGLLLGAAAVAVAFLYSDKVMEMLVRARNRSVGG